MKKIQDTQEAFPYLALCTVMLVIQLGSHVKVVIHSIRQSRAPQGVPPPS